MNDLIEDIKEAMAILREKRMKNICMTDTYLKELSRLESIAEKKYNELELDEGQRNIIDELISCINALDDYCFDLFYSQGILDGANLVRLKEADLK